MNDLDVAQALPEDHAILANLLEFYVYDFSELLGLDVEEIGRFGYPELGQYWSEPGRYAFLIRKGGKLAGLALVQKVATRWDITEFFVLRAYRRHGVATQAVKEVWARFPGAWNVRVRERNAPALCFWKAAIEDFVGREITPDVIEIEGDLWRVFSFESTMGCDE